MQYKNQFSGLSESERHAKYKSIKETIKHLVNSQSELEHGDIIWGWESIEGTIKTGARKKINNSKEISELTIEDCPDEIYNGFENGIKARKFNPKNNETCYVFIFVGRIDSINSKNTKNNQKVKYATYCDIQVLDSFLLFPKE